MTNVMPDRGPITDVLVEHLTTTLEPGILVGDGVRKPASGWSGGQPGQGNFVPSVLVATLDGLPNFRDTIRDRHSSWKLIYRLGTAGGVRKQADDAADAVRAATLALPRDALGGWKIVDVVFSRQAPVEPQAPTDHPTFLVNDQVEIWLERSRG